MGSRLKSLVAAALIQGVVVYALVLGLRVTMTSNETATVTVVDIPGERALPPPPAAEARPIPPPARRASSVPGRLLGKAIQPVEWAAASPAQREAAFTEIQQWRQDNMPEDELRLINWRNRLPQGSGPGKVTRLRPSNLTTHTLYWPADWTQGALPIIAWGNGNDGICSNSSLTYAAFLSEIASHGYFVVAAGNDDIEYPQPEGIEILADGRPIRTQPQALRAAVDWAVAENGRGGSPYAGKLDTSKIAYMGHGCGAGQAISASSDPRTSTTVVLNASARFSPDAAAAHKPALAQFDGSQDGSKVIEAGAANFARAETASWPMYKATLEGIDHSAAYSGPDRRWSKVVLAWLNWQLKEDSSAAGVVAGLSRNGWSAGATGLTLTP